jgi:ABC-type amino acid transport substrate-binding protein
MKKKLIVTLFALLMLLAVCANSQELKKLNLDDTSAIGTMIQSDTQIKAEGKSSIRISTLWPTTICLGEVTGLNVENAKLLCKAKVKSDLDGTAYLELWAQVGSGQYFSRGTNDVVSQKTDWKTIQTPFLFQQGQKPDKVTLNLVINGKGTVWIDDIVLSKDPLK